jgi:hypothetical protein
MVNENSLILSLLLLVSQFLSANVCVIFYLDLFCVGSTHLHTKGKWSYYIWRLPPNFFMQYLIQDNNKNYCQQNQTNPVAHIIKGAIWFLERKKNNICNWNYPRVPSQHQRKKSLGFNTKD